MANTVQPSSTSYTYTHSHAHTQSHGHAHTRKLSTVSACSASSTLIPAAFSSSSAAGEREPAASAYIQLWLRVCADLIRKAYVHYQSQPSTIAAH